MARQTRVSYAISNRRSVNSSIDASRETKQGSGLECYPIAATDSVSPFDDHVAVVALAAVAIRPGPRSIPLPTTNDGPSSVCTVLLICQVLLGAKGCPQ
jgi:hypothetical protein